MVNKEHEVLGWMLPEGETSNIVSVRADGVITGMI